MLNSSEKNILDTFIKIYEMNTINFIDDKKEDLNIVFDENHIPNKLVNLFFKKLLNNLSNILYLSTIYSFGYSEKAEHVKLIKYIEYKKENINNINEIDEEFKRVFLYNTIKYILKKRNNNVDLIKEDFVSEIYKINIEHVDNLEIVYTINELQRAIIFKLLSKYTPIEAEKFIYEVITTEDFDNDIISLSLNTLNNKNDITYFKTLLIRTMLQVSYILDYYACEEKIKELNNIPNTNVHCMTPIIMYVINCMNKGKYTLPKEKELSLSIINRYLYSIHNKIDEEKIEEKKKELTKINPLFFL